MKLYHPFLNKLLVDYLRSPEHPMKQRFISYINRLNNYRGVIGETIYNVKMVLDLRDIVQNRIFFQRVWEPNLSIFINNQLDEEDIFFDIGCNVGYFALLASTKCVKTFAFDPDPKNIEVVNFNRSINFFNNITTLNFGLGDKNESLQFFRASIGNNGLSGFTSRNSTENFAVPVYTLDYLIYKEKLVPFPTFMKIDTEGWEEKILHGATHLLKTNPPRIIIFESEFLGNESINDFNSIKSFLLQYDYTITDTLSDEYGTNHIARFNAKQD